MKNPVRLALLAALGLLGFWLWTVLYPSPEKVIRKQLQHLASTASFPTNEGMLSRVARAQRLGGYFSTNVEINLDIPGHGGQRFMDREEIMQAAVAARTQIGSLDVQFPNITVIVNADKQSASAELTLQAHGSRGQDPIIQELNCALKKVDGKWLITRVKTVRIFS